MPAFVGQRRAGDVTADLLQHFAVVGVSKHSRVRAETMLDGAQEHRTPVATLASELDRRRHQRSAAECGREAGIGVARLSTPPCRCLAAGSSLHAVTSLAPGVEERLLRPYFTTKNDGNGLGLRLSQGLVERYGGGIGTGNRTDRQSGAVFSVRLLTEPQAPEVVNTHDGRPGNVVNASP